MKKILAITISLCSFAFVPLAAQASGYLGVNYTHTNGKYLKLKTEDLTVRLGGNITNYFATELRLATTVGKDSVGNGGDYGFDYRVGGYVKLAAPLGAFRPYLVGGHTWNHESISGAHGSGNSANTDDWSYGLGLDLNATETIGINVEYMRLLDEDRRIDAYSAGAYYRF